MGKKVIAFIDFLKFFAILLIINSHCKGVYPSDILSFGGGFGLALFYMISGYLLANINERTKLINWYPKKLLGLYIPLWIISGTELLIGYIKIDSIAYFLERFIYPGMWFTASMVIMYLAYYLFIKIIFLRYKEKGIYFGIIALIVTYGILYYFKPSIATFSFEHLKVVNVFSIETPYLITHMAWMCCMLIGLLIREKWNDNNVKINPSTSIIISVICMVLFMTQRFGEKMEFRYLTNLEVLLPMFYIGFAVGFFFFFMQFEKKFQLFISTPIGKAISLVGHSSLEAYYIQFVWISKLRDLVFPINIILIFGGVFVSALIFHNISQSILKRI